MGEKLETCETCEHLEAMKTVGGFPLYGCSETGFVIPHGTEPDTIREGYDTTFYRVPMDCPLPDDEVVKREALAC